MTVVDFTFPQSGDADYADNFGTWLGRSNITDYVEDGFGFTVDYTVPEVTISQGKAFVSIPQATISATSETRLTLDYCITKPSATLSLTGSTTNYVYLNPNLGSDDAPSFAVYTDETNANSDSLKLGEIDTTNDVETLTNREPDADFDVATFATVLNIPVYSDIANAEKTEGNVAWVTGSGPTTEGLYVHDGSGYNKTDIDEINELDDVTGVTALIEDSGSNRPVAGTEGRIFFDTSNRRVEYDDGSQWLVLGQDASTIGAADLGFDPATQAEFDSHTSNSAAHHSRYTDEEVRDAVNVLLSQGNNVDLAYDDANDSLIITVDNVDNGMTLNSVLNADTTSGRIVLPVGVDQYAT